MGFVDDMQMGFYCCDSDEMRYRRILKLLRSSCSSEVLESLAPYICRYLDSDLKEYAEAVEKYVKDERDEINIYDLVCQTWNDRWIDFFLIDVCVGCGECPDLDICTVLVESRLISFGSRRLNNLWNGYSEPERFLFAAFYMLHGVAETHNHICPAHDWHIHLMNKKKTRYEGRLLFDSHYPQTELAIEPHAGGRSGHRHIKLNTLQGFSGTNSHSLVNMKVSKQISDEIYVAALKAVSSSGQIAQKGVKYAVWSTWFCPVGSDGRVVHTRNDQSLNCSWHNHRV